MKRSHAYLSALLFSIVLISCSKSNESDLNGNNNNPPPGGGNTNGCDTVNMKFATNIKPILHGNCYTCHSNENFAVSGVKLEDYDDLKMHVDDGDIMGVITHAAGFPAMPQGGAKLSDCNIIKIRAWIDRGAPNN